MKKIIAFLILISVCLSFSACGGFFKSDSNYTLENLREEYRSDMLAHARSLTDVKSGEFEVVILEKEQTIEKIEVYTTGSKKYDILPIIFENVSDDDVFNNIFVSFFVFS